jgi:hypothetical protein
MLVSQVEGVHSVPMILVRSDQVNANSDRPDARSVVLTLEAHKVVVGLQVAVGLNSANSQCQSG